MIKLVTSAKQAKRMSDRHKPFKSQESRKVMKRVLLFYTINLEQPIIPKLDQIGGLGIFLGPGYIGFT